MDNKDSLRLVMNAATEVKNSKKREAELEASAREEELKDITALSSYQKMEAELMPFLEAYLYAARQSGDHRGFYFKTDKQFEVQADPQTNVTAVAVRLSTSDYLRYSVADEGYFIVPKHTSQQYLSGSDLVKPENDKDYMDLTDVLSQIGTKIGNKDDKKFEENFAKHFDTGGKCKLETLPATTPTLKKHTRRF